MKKGEGEDDRKYRNSQSLDGRRTRSESGNKGKGKISMK
jgi:hypothetical protein